MSQNQMRDRLYTAGLEHDKCDHCNSLRE